MTDKQVRELSKSSYSEMVIRKALFWLSGECEWTLDETAEVWVVTLHTPQAEASTLLDRLLNDQLLRETIDGETRNIRRRIIRKALRDMDSAT